MQRRHQRQRQIDVMRFEMAAAAKRVELGLVALALPGKAIRAIWTPRLGVNADGDLWSIHRKLPSIHTAWILGAIYLDSAVGIAPTAQTVRVQIRRNIVAADAEFVAMPELRRDRNVSARRVERFPVGIHVDKADLNNIIGNAEWFTLQFAAVARDLALLSANIAMHQKLGHAIYEFHSSKCVRHLESRHGPLGSTCKVK